MNYRRRDMPMLKAKHYRRLRGERLVSGRNVAVLVGAVIFGGAVGIGPALVSQGRSDRASELTQVRYSATLSDCSVTDGDTIRCGSERIRLLGIDAPELPGHCREGRVCAPGDPYASTASLEAGLIGELTIERLGEDHYGRTLALVDGAKGDLSCFQLQHAQAIYKVAWDNGLRVARACPSLV